MREYNKISFINNLSEQKINEYKILVDKNFKEENSISKIYRILQIINHTLLTICFVAYIFLLFFALENPKIIPAPFLVFLLCMGVIFILINHIIRKKCDDGHIIAEWLYMRTHQDAFNWEQKKRVHIIKEQLELERLCSFLKQNNSSIIETSILYSTLDFFENEIPNLYIVAELNDSCLESFCIKNGITFEQDNNDSDTVICDIENMKVFLPSREA